MKKLILGSSILIGTGLLTACGGGGGMGSGDANNAPVSSAKALKIRAKATVATDYANVVQQLYISYFGRPADPGGLTNFEAQLLNDNAPTTIQDLTVSYGNNATIKALIDTFGTSAESNTLYGSGDTTSFVTAIFTNVLGRAPASAGLSFWVGAIDGGSVTKSNAALSIMAGALENTTAQGLIDAQLIANRVSVANNFTAALSTPGQVNAYSGSSAAASARTMLATVNSTTSVSGFQPTVMTQVSTLITLKFTAIQAIVKQRCLPCHSSTPTEPGYSSAPLGYMYDTPAEIAQYASIMNANVTDNNMPFGNATGMTAAERTTFENWYNAGAMQSATSTPTPTPTPTPGPSPTPTPTPTPAPTPSPGW